MSQSAMLGEAASSPGERYFQLSLLGLLACGYLAIAGTGYLPNLVVGLTALPLLFRFLVVTCILRVHLPDSWVTALTVAYVGFYPLDYLFVSEDFLQASVHLVLFLAAAKLLTARTDRDYASLISIALLELVAAAILSLNLSFFVFLGLFLWFAVSTFVSWEIRRSVRSPVLVSRAGTRLLNRRLTGLTGLLTAGILLLTSGLFFILPRTAQAAFQRLIPDRFQVTAFSNQVTLGEIGEVKRNSAVMMRVRIDGVDGPVALKWRGTALSDFDGKRWSNRPEKAERLDLKKHEVVLADENQLRRKGNRISYEVQLQPFAGDVLFIAGRPEYLRSQLRSIRRTAWDSYQLSYAAGEVLGYVVYSYIEDPWSEKPAVQPILRPLQAKDYLVLPALDRRVGELARRVTLGGALAEDKAKALERYLQTSYGYTLDLPEVEPADPIANFLFERRAGHCEYFASAMAVMLRSIGIPSRVATGFQSGTYNPISGWHVIRGSDAHSWVEAFIPRQGWITYDPTPPDFSRAGLGLWFRVGLLVDAAETFWQDWVVNYDENRQYSLVGRLAERRAGISEAWSRTIEGVKVWARNYGRVLMAAMLVAALVIVMVTVVRPWLTGKLHARRVLSGEVRSSDATRIYLRALELLRRGGFQKPAWITPSEFARGLPPSAPSAVFADLTRAYNELRFGARREAASRLMVLLSELEQALRTRPF